jgi:tRNA C32,U32 (ribose-2'-O)-methylase TrmJ
VSDQERLAAVEKALKVLQEEHAALAADHEQIREALERLIDLIDVQPKRTPRENSLADWMASFRARARAKERELRERGLLNGR